MIALLQAGWIIQDIDELNLFKSLGVVVREFGLALGYGTVDDLLFVNGKAVGVQKPSE